jgi:hypothetical protein
MDSPSPTAAALIDTAHESLIRFLRLELSIAHTMLDAADTTREEASRERRRSRAHQACAEVARYLGADAKRSGLRSAERQELTEGLSAIRARMAAAPPGGREPSP